MYGLGGIKRLNDNWIAKQANHEAMLNRAREHADSAADDAAIADAARDRSEYLPPAEVAHASYKCGGTVQSGRPWSE